MNQCDKIDTINFLLIDLSMSHFHIIIIISARILVHGYKVPE